MSATIELHKYLDIPGLQALAAMTEIVQGIAEHRPPYDRTTLEFGLELAGPLRRVTPSVPIDMEANPKPDRYECEIEIAAREAPKLFPRFLGTVSISPLRDSGCELWLQGTYKAPLGPFGDAVDTTLLHGAARQSLERFVDWMAEEIGRLAPVT